MDKLSQRSSKYLHFDFYSLWKQAGGAQLAVKWTKLELSVKPFLFLWYRLKCFHSAAENCSLKAAANVSSTFCYLDHLFCCYCLSLLFCFVLFWAVLTLNLHHLFSLDKL